MGFLQKIGIKLFLKTIFPKKGDWKTKTGSILIMIGMLLQQLPPLFPMQELVSSFLIAIGTGLGGVGIADKLNKMGADIPPEAN